MKNTGKLHVVDPLVKLVHSGNIYLVNIQTHRVALYRSPTKSHELANFVRAITIDQLIELIVKSMGETIP